MPDQNADIAQHIKTMIDQEIAEFQSNAHSNPLLLDAFRAMLREPRLVTVNFSGGLQQKCWSVTRTDGDYRVIYLPSAGYFSLCVESDFGPLDIGVHGSAIGCFASV